MSTSMDISLLKLTKQKEKLQKKLTEIENIILGIEKAKQYSDENKIVEGDTIETMILKKYLELGSVKKVSDFINELGYRIKTNYREGTTPGRKYISSDISDLIIREDLEVDKELQEFALMIYEMNLTSMQNIFV